MVIVADVDDAFVSISDAVVAETAVAEMPETEVVGAVLRIKVRAELVVRVVNVFAVVVAKADATVVGEASETKHCCC